MGQEKPTWRSSEATRPHQERFFTHDRLDCTLAIDFTNGPNFAPTCERVDNPRRHCVPANAILECMSRNKFVTILGFSFAAALYKNTFNQKCTTLPVGAARWKLLARIFIYLL